MTSSRFIILSFIALILILSGGIVSAQPSKTLYLDVTALTDYPDFFGVSQAQYPPHIDTAIEIHIAEVTPEPIPNAGDCDGTTGDDVIDCASNPINPDDIVEADLGDDTVTINAGVIVGHIGGDTIPGRPNTRWTEGGNDTIIVYGIAMLVWGDDVLNRDGGNDHITIEASGVVENVAGDNIYILQDNVTVYGGDDVIINNGEVERFLQGDRISIQYGMNSYTYGGNDSITNNGIAQGIYGDFLFAFGTKFGGQDNINNTGTVTEDIYGDSISDSSSGSNLPTGEGAADIITNSGTVGGTIFAEGGDDLVILQTGANGGDDNNLPVDGGIGTDTLRFEFALSQTQIDEINALDPANDSYTIDGQTFTWANFEVIQIASELTCPDGTAGDDVIVCETDPPIGTNDDNSIEAGVGIDNVTINNGITIQRVIGDGILGDPEARLNGNGSADTIINNGTVSLGIQGDNIAGGDGGNDTIINNNSVNTIMGDDISTGNGGNDIITNNSFVHWLMGDGINRGDGGDDTITNSTGATTELLAGDLVSDGSGGDDTITLEVGSSSYFVVGDEIYVSDNTNIQTLYAGDDIIINHGLIAAYNEGNSDLMGSLIGDLIDNTYGNLYAGQDTITNTGTVETNIYGDYVIGQSSEPTGEGASDTITNSGTVGGTIFAEGGDDLVILQTGANGGDDNSLPLDGGIGTDTLRFDFTLTQIQINEINALDPANDSYTIDGQTFTWANFEIIQVASELECSDGTTGDDVIVCEINPTSPDAIVDGGLGNDDITVQAGVTVSEVNGDSQSGGAPSVGTGGFDIITIDGLVTGDVNGDGVTGEGRDDTIIINATGEIQGVINGNTGNDLFIINVDASVGADDVLDVAGGIGGYDLLVFDVTSLSQETIAQLRRDNPVFSSYNNDMTGSIVIQGVTYNYTGMDEIRLSAELSTLPMGDCDGTPNADTINCTVSPTNPDSSIDAGLGNDIITVASDVEFQSLSGDLGLDLPYFPIVGGDDIITINTNNPTNDGYDIFGDWITGDGGDDTIINTGGLIRNGRNTGGISGDYLNLSNLVGALIGGSGGDDTITNTGSLWAIFGDSIIINRATFETSITYGGNDLITNDGTIDEITGDLFYYAYTQDYISTATPQPITVFGGDDTIINNGQVGSEQVLGRIIGDGANLDPAPVEGGDDTITNNGTVYGSIWGDEVFRIIGDTNITGGQDIITNTGTITSDIYGDLVSDMTPDFDADFNYWRFNITLSEDGNNDTITNSGTVGGSILANGGDDLVILQTGANGGDDNNLPLDGGIGMDTLRFEFALNQTQIDEINALDPANDSYTIDGQTFTWTNFEVIQVTSELDCPDGTAGDDIIVCETDPPFGTNTDMNIEAGAGQDDITINAGVSVFYIYGDFYDSNGFDDNFVNYGDVGIIYADASDYYGGNDTVINHGEVGEIFGDEIFNHDDTVTVLNGGDDYITNTATGVVNHFIIGDEISISANGAENAEIYGGADQITNYGELTGFIIGDGLNTGLGANLSAYVTGGDDIIINNGMVFATNADHPGHIIGDYIVSTNALPGEDQITNTGSIDGDIYGDFITLVFDLVTPPTGEGAGDIITNSGTVGGAIYAEGGDDVVNLQDGANGGDDNSLTIDGGSGIDILNFDFTNLSQNILGALLLADPANGSIVIDGQTFIWLNFEQIITGPVPAPSEPTNMLVSGDIENPPAQPIYSWDRIPVATSYQFYVGGPSGQVINQTLVVGVDVTCNATCDFQPAIDLVQGNYTWWMQATNDSGASDWVQGPNFYVGPSAPVAPTGLTVTGSLTQPPVLPTYSWEWDTSVAWYQVVVNSPSDTVFNTWFDASLICSDTTCSITPDNELTINGDYLWWVGGWNETAQTWSDANGAIFTVAIPLPVAPENVLVTGSLTQPPVLPTYSWGVDENVLWYQVVLTGATSGTIFNTWFDASVICNDTTCTITPTNELNNDAYTLWIGGWNPVGQTWNTGENFTVAIPLPAVPNNALVAGSLTQPPVLPIYSWDVDENVLWYQVVLTGATSGAIFNSWHDAPLICDANTCTITPTNELNNDTYTLWIGGWNTVGQTWNAGEIFVVDIPLPAVPTNITTSGTYNQPTYSWDRDDNALWYQVILNNSGGASVFNTWHDASVICTESTCSITPVNVLPDGTYTLWVGGWNSSGQTWNAGENITITAP